MSAERDDRTPLSRDEQAFVRSVAAAYTPPPLSASQRARFEARLEERIAATGPRRRGLGVAFAFAGALLALVVWRAQLEPRSGAVAVAPRESTSSGDAWLLAMAIEPASDSDDALPADYVAISDLLIGD